MRPLRREVVLLGRPPDGLLDAGAAGCPQRHSVDTVEPLAGRGDDNGPTRATGAGVVVPRPRPSPHYAVPLRVEGACPGFGIPHLRHASRARPRCGRVYGGGYRVGACHDRSAAARPG
ncbi:hypothetical protein GCM10009629_42080 [Pseudonocardia alni]